MSELATWIADWRHAVPTAVAFVIAPSLLIRIVIRAWPKGDPRRRELLAEFAAMPVPKRLMWVLGVFELAWQEGLCQRQEQSVLLPKIARLRLPGAVMFGAIALDVVGIAVVDIPMVQVGFAISALALFPLTVKHVRATYAIADITARLADDMANLTKGLETHELRVPDAWKDATARVASDARRPRWCRTFRRIPLDAPVPHLDELGLAVVDDASRQHMERLEVQLQRDLHQLWRNFDEQMSAIEARLIDDLERAGADETTVATYVRLHRLTVATNRPAR